MWHKNPKYKGLQIMTIGFLSALLGAGVTILGGFLRTAADTFGILLLYFGWLVLIVGAIAMLVGIFIHWSSMFSNERRQS
jgi:hypothetical protein